MSEYDRFTQSVNAHLGLNLFVKDVDGRYIYASEDFVRSSGMDSCQQLLGKTDYDLVWRDQADYFRETDRQVMSGAAFDYVSEKQGRNDQYVDVLVTKQQYFDEQGRLLGVAGSFIECAHKVLVDTMGRVDYEKKCVKLGREFGDTQLTYKELEVYYYSVLGNSANQIAALISRSKRTVEYHTNELKRKLQCRNRSELISFALTTGLIHTINHVLS